MRRLGKPIEPTRRYAAEAGEGAPCEEPWPTPTRGHGPAVAPFFCLTRAAWIPYALTWDSETGEFRGIAGPRGFATYREAVEASRFLVGAVVR